MIIARITYLYLISYVCYAYLGNGRVSNKLSKTPLSSSLGSVPRLPGKKLGGKVVITGLGDLSEDELTFSVLKEQNIWDPVIVATPEVEILKKRFLSRSARYSGLLNILDFTPCNIEDSSSLVKALAGANTWLAFNVAEEDIPFLADAALEAKIVRMMITCNTPSSSSSPSSSTSLAPAGFGSSSMSSNTKKKILSPGLPLAVAQSIARLESSPTNCAVTILYHGPLQEKVIDSEPYYITRTGQQGSLYQDRPIGRALLGRLVAEMLLLPSTYAQACGVCEGDEISQSYLEILRSTGITRGQEVYKMFHGGLDNALAKTAENYQDQVKLEEKEEEVKEQKRLLSGGAPKALPSSSSSSSSSKSSTAALVPDLEDEELLIDERFKFTPEGVPIPKGFVISAANRDSLMYPFLGKDKKTGKQLNKETFIQRRTQEILEDVYEKYMLRLMVTQDVTTKQDFIFRNTPKAQQLALKEYMEKETEYKEYLTSMKLKKVVQDEVSTAKRLAYRKLLQLEKMEMNYQKSVSSNWVKFVYLLLETTMLACKEEGILFHDLDGFQQTLILREQANVLREECKIPEHDVIYDPEDAQEIVTYMKKTKFGKQLGLNLPAEQILTKLADRYGRLLKNIQALQGAKQIIETAIETLEAELPPSPPEVSEILERESKMMQKRLNDERISKIRNRFKSGLENEEVYGKL